MCKRFIRLQPSIHVDPWWNPAVEHQAFARIIFGSIAKLIKWDEITLVPKHAFRELHIMEVVHGNSPACRIPLVHHRNTNAKSDCRYSFVIVRESCQKAIKLDPTLAVHNIVELIFAQ
jgi:hypothetical protein